MERSLEFVDGALIAVDQTALPAELRTVRLSTVDEIIDAIDRMVVRGAPALGVVGAFGVAISARRHRSTAGTVDVAQVSADADRLAAARPTAVNLGWGVRRALAVVENGADAVLAEAIAIAAEDEQVNRAIAARAANLVRELCDHDRPLRLLTHCNTGGLATVAWGTALGTIRDLAATGDVAEVLATETRPLLQGARLTVWELTEAGIPHRLCVDSAAAAAIAAGQVDCVLVGADRVAANGDVANKIGTYPLALAAARHGVPFVVCAPESTMDDGTASGDEIAIEERRAGEVRSIGATTITLPNVPVFNPAFDVTPHDLVTAIVTEQRVHRPAHPLADLAEPLLQRVRVISDFPQPGIAFQDLAGVYTDPVLFAALATAVTDAFAEQFTHVLALEARGFLLGTAVGLAAGRPVVLARKAGKLPGPTRGVSYGLEYGSDRLEMQVAAFGSGDRVLIVDDVLATGGTLAAAAELVAMSGAVVAGYAVLLELAGLGGRKLLDAEPPQLGDRDRPQVLAVARKEVS